MNALSFFAALAFMPWCAAAAGPSSAPAGAELVSIEISPASPELYIDFTVQLAAIGTFSDGTTMDLTDVVWGSSNALVVLVSNAPGSEGLATAITGGTATITAFHADSGLLGSTDILVHEESLMGITVAPLTLSVPVGVIVRFGAFGVLTGGMSIVMTDLVEWSSTDDAVATISNDPGTRGETTTVGAGVADIQATHADTGVSGSTSLFVSTVAPVAVQVTPVSSSVPVGFERSLTATGLFPDGRSYDLTSTASWSSGAPSVMTLDSMEGREGIATGVAAGAAFATATHSASAVSGSTLVTVMDVGLTEIGVAPAGLFLPAGITQPFSASGVFTDGSLLDLTRQVSWASMDEAIATVGDVGETKGRVTGVSMGVTAIEATHTAAGISGTRLMAVTDATLTEIDVSPSDPVLPLALIQAFTATGHFCDATVLDLTTSVRWTPGNPALVTISDVLGTKGHAVVNPIQVGSAAVTARDEASGVTGSSAVSVVDEVLVQVDVAPIDPSIPTGRPWGSRRRGTSPAARFSTSPARSRGRRARTPSP